MARVSPAVASPPAPTPPPARDKVYRVRPGDTLFAIAQRHETTVAALASMNGLSQRASVKAGQTLRLPAAPQPVVSAEKTPQKGVIMPVVTPGQKRRSAACASHGSDRSKTGPSSTGR